MRVVNESINVDRKGLGSRMKVIGAGLPRCATSSLQAAFESPTFNLNPCMHMAHIAPNAGRERLILQAMQEDNREKRQKLLHEVFDGFEATTDFPGFWFIDDLMDMYPDAHIVLNQREGGGDAWFQSFTNAIGFFMTRTYYYICFPQVTDRLHWQIHHVAKGLWRKRWGCERGQEFYDVYQAFVLAEAKKRGRDVLIWKAQDGWKPLCELLGKESPKEPFPWVNDAATMATVKKILVARGILSWTAIVGGIYASWRYGPGLLARIPGF